MAPIFADLGNCSIYRHDCMIIHRELLHRTNCWVVHSKEIFNYIMVVWVIGQGVSQGFKIGRPGRFCGRGPIFSWVWSHKNMCFGALPQFFVVMELCCCYSLNLCMKYTVNNLKSI